MKPSVQFFGHNKEQLLQSVQAMEKSTFPTASSFDLEVKTLKVMARISELTYGCVGARCVFPITLWKESVEVPENFDQSLAASLPNDTIVAVTNVKFSKFEGFNFTYLCMHLHFENIFS
ncbi:hypothetical protein LXL04_023370 [Taraxacum kok-saghyz]